MKRLLLFVLLSACSQSASEPDLIVVPAIEQPFENYQESGPFEVRIMDGLRFPSMGDERRYRAYRPNNAEVKPLVVFGTANVKDKCQLIDAYDNLLSHVASYGFEVVVPDMRDLSCVTPNRENIEKRALVMRELKTHIILKSEEPRDHIYFGHSRSGGAALWATHVDEAALGAVALTPISLRSYGFPEEIRPFRALNVVAGNDSDLKFPYGESLEDTLNGDPTTLIIGGALHTWMGDEIPMRDEAEPGIEKRDQQIAVRMIVTAYINGLADDPNVLKLFTGRSKSQLMSLIEDVTGGGEEPETKVIHRWLDSTATIISEIEDENDIGELEWLDSEDDAEEESEIPTLVYPYGRSVRHVDAVGLRFGPGEYEFDPEELGAVVHFQFRAVSGSGRIDCGEAQEIGYHRFQQFVIDVERCEEVVLEVDDGFIDLKDAMVFED